MNVPAIRSPTALRNVHLQTTLELIMSLNISCIPFSAMRIPLCHLHSITFSLLLTCFSSLAHQNLHILSPIP